MTTDPSSILDPVTGLPLDQFSGIIQQIPLGSQVFPFKDLNADGRMTRQPIYGDDILPTSALVVGQDTNGEARAGTMDMAQRLYTREAVFQNLGDPIPDGETAPVDVNVVSGGGGGGGGNMPFTTGYRASGNAASGIVLFDTLDPAPKTIYGFTGCMFARGMVVGAGGLWSHCTIAFGHYTSGIEENIFSDVLSYDPNIPQMINAHVRWNMLFPGGWPVPGTYTTANPFTIYTNSPSFNLYVTYTILYV